MRNLSHWIHHVKFTLRSIFGHQGLPTIIFILILRVLSSKKLHKCHVCAPFRSRHDSLKFIYIQSIKPHLKITPRSIHCQLARLCVDQSQKGFPFFCSNSHYINRGPLYLMPLFFRSHFSVVSLGSPLATLWKHLKSNLDFFAMKVRNVFNKPDQ